MNQTGLKGLDNVLNNLNKEIQGIKDRSMQGLINAAILIRRDMDETPPMIPVDTGNLRASWIPGTPIYEKDKFGIIIGFSAAYAVFVHEMVDKSNKSINWNRPGSGAKFFESALKRNEKEIVRIIAENAKIK